MIIRKTYYSLVLFFSLFIAILSSCSKQSALPVNPPPADTSGNGSTNNLQPADNVKLFDSLFFTAIRWYDNDAKQYFSTLDTSFKQPMNYSDMTAAQLKNVDLVFFYDPGHLDDCEGFLNPVTASIERKQYYDDQGNNYYYYPWLASSVGTQLYLTRLNEQQLDSAKKYKGFLNKYFSDTSLIHLTHDSYNYFPYGGGTGGNIFVYDSAWNMDGQLRRGKIFGFENTKLQKRGFLFIRQDQESTLWQTPVYHFGVKVDIVKEQ